MKYVILFSLVLASCWTPKQKYDRLIMKYPDLIETDTVTIKDTLVEIDTITTEEFSDSFIIQHDTFFETKKLKISKKGNRFGITIKPDTLTFRDTISYQVKVPGRIFIKRELNPWWPWWLLLAFITGMIIGHRIKP
jgi:hypothetical protein